LIRCFIRPSTTRVRFTAEPVSFGIFDISFWVLGVVNAAKYIIILVKAAYIHVVTWTTWYARGLLDVPSGLLVVEPLPPAVTARELLDIADLQ
jgi:hypothetical protein